MSGGADTDELKALISQSLESKGILGKIKAQLRASVVTAINEYEGLNTGTYLENVGAKKIRDHFEAQIGLGLVCEFLEYYGFQYTLSVLLPEANLAERRGLPGPDQVSQYLRVPPSGRGQPLLVDLVASIKNPSSSSAVSHPSPSISPHASYPQSPRSDPPASPRSPRAQPTHWPTKTTTHTANTTNSPTIKKLAIPALSVPGQLSPTQPPSTKLLPSQLYPQSQLNHSVPQPQSLPQPQPQPQKPQLQHSTPASIQKQAQPTAQRAGELKVNDLKANELKVNDLKANELKVNDLKPNNKVNDDGRRDDQKNKEAAYLSYPEGDDDIDEEIEEDVYDLDGDLGFEDDEDIEIDAAPLKKPDNKANIAEKVDLDKSSQPTTAPKTPLALLTKPAAPPSALAPAPAPASASTSVILANNAASNKKQDVQSKHTQRDKFELDDSDSDPGSLEEDMKRLEVIEQKLNLFGSNKSLTLSNPVPPLLKPNTASATLRRDDDELDSIASDYENEFSDDALTADHSMSDHSMAAGDYDHEEDID